MWLVRHFKRFISLLLRRRSLTLIVCWTVPGARVETVPEVNTAKCLTKSLHLNSHTMSSNQARGPCLFGQLVTHHWDYPNGGFFFFQFQRKRNKKKLKKLKKFSKRNIWQFSIKTETPCHFGCGSIANESENSVRHANMEGSPWKLCVAKINFRYRSLGELSNINCSRMPFV